MLKDFRQIYTVAIVFTGDFNPIIIQPFWLAQKKLIGEQEASGASVELIHRDLVRFEIDWFYVEVTKVRFEIRTSKEPYFEPLKDLMLGIFEYLKETPITNLGINHIMHIPLKDEAQNDNLGKRLAALDTFSMFLKDPKILDLNIVEQVRKDKLPGSFQIRLSSTDQTTAKKGLAININDHYGLAVGDNGRSGEIIKLLSNNWRFSFERVEEVSESFWSNFIS